MTSPIFKTKAGRLTPYALACGYIEQLDFNHRRVTLWLEHCVYHVRSHDFQSNQRLSWETFESLTLARKEYDKIKRGLLCY